MSKLINHTSSQIDKIGNSIVYLIEHMGKGSLTKISLLKLIYILEEKSIEKLGIPFFNLQYEIWKFGPVAKEVHYELYEDLNVFKGYIEKRSEESGILIYSKSEFNDDEFSDNDIDILQMVVNDFKESTEQNLIDYTHRPGSLWHKSAVENGILDKLLDETIIQTDINIDFSQLLEDENDIEYYKSHLEFLQFCNFKK